MATFSSCSSGLYSWVACINNNLCFGYFPWDFPACRELIVLSAAAGYGNYCVHVIYSRIGPVMLGPAESAILWDY